MLQLPNLNEDTDCCPEVKLVDYEGIVERADMETGVDVEGQVRWGILRTLKGLVVNRIRYPPSSLDSMDLAKVQRFYELVEANDEEKLGEVQRGLELDVLLQEYGDVAEKVRGLWDVDELPVGMRKRLEEQRRCVENEEELEGVEEMEVEYV